MDVLADIDVFVATGIKKYRRRGTYEAAQIPEDGVIDAMPEWAQDHLTVVEDPEEGAKLVCICSSMAFSVFPGDYLLRNEQGEVSVCRKHNFERSFEEAP